MPRTLVEGHGFLGAALIQMVVAFVKDSPDLVFQIVVIA
jgi:hypothetical protein